ncbi:polysaccharide deacetylase family protein [Kineobactrum salinum]|uniref:Polysaccharide deacetylase family protein n=1 Tax=Kineobactrum salinum TaxID=2708301 RepID=A0A6C0TYH5_9GAMM|nr:polysaccharide deacetylase family protein [Kineobactrum salinum]
MFGWGLSVLGRIAARGKLSILIYHQVLAEADPMRPSEPTAEVFDWQMALLARHFTPLSLDDALDGLKNGTLPANAVCVTFDDGYLNNLTVAQPILEKYRIPATVYVATAFSRGVNMWNDRVIHLFAEAQRDALNLGGEWVSLGGWPQRRQLAEHWLRQLKYLPVEQRLEQVRALYTDNTLAEQPPLMMTPEQVRTLSDKGIVIGAHTVNHPILKVLPAAQQQQEIQQSKTELEDWTGKEVRHFAYPNGVEGKDLDGDTMRHVQEAGFSTAVVTNWGTSDADTSPFALRRFTPWDRSAARFHLRLLRNQVFS